MVKPICERGKVCVFLKKNISSHKGFESLDYICNNPKRFKSYEIPHYLNHKEKYGYCKVKVTDVLESFF